MKSEKNLTDPVPAANRANTQPFPSHETEHGKPKSTVPEERTTKAQSNPKNALKSTGPTTARGKSYSRNNARKHGLYSRELFVSEADNSEFQKMRVDLEADLKPGTTLQRFAFDYVVACHWRCKLAARLEFRQFAHQLQDEQPEKTDVDPVIERWYGVSRADIRSGIRSLEYAMKEFDEIGYFREDTKTFLTRGFGEDFLGILEKWTTMSADAILLADHLVRHRKVFGKVPDTDVKSPSTLGETTRVVIDPRQGRQMVGALLEERRNYLRELLIMERQNTLQGMRDAAQNSDFSPRFLADANRELRRAVSWYFFLKENNL